MHWKESNMRITLSSSLISLFFSTLIHWWGRFPRRGAKGWFQGWEWYLESNKRSWQGERSSRSMTRVPSQATEGYRECGGGIQRQRPKWRNRSRRGRPEWWWWCRVVCLGSRRWGKREEGDTMSRREEEGKKDDEEMFVDFLYLL